MQDWSSYHKEQVDLKPVWLTLFSLASSFKRTSDSLLHVLASVFCSSVMKGVVCGPYDKLRRYQCHALDSQAKINLPFMDG